MTSQTTHHMDLSIAIVIVNYNYARFLQTAIDSALHQTCPAQRILVIDDGSDDQSRDIIKSYADQIEFHFKPNGGQPSAYNASLQLVQEDLVLFLDSDDTLERHCISEVLSAWRPDVVKVQFPLRYMTADGEIMPGVIPRVRHIGAVSHIARKFGAYISPPSSGNVYQRRYLSKVFPLEETRAYSADTIPIVLAPCYGEVLSLAKCLGNHRIHHFQGQDPTIKNSLTNGQGLNHVHRAGWLQRSVQRDLNAFQEFKKNLETQTGLRLTDPVPKVPSLLRYMAVLQRTEERCHQLPDTGHLCRTGLSASLEYPDYKPQERILLLCWFLFLWLVPDSLLRRIMRSQIGIRRGNHPLIILPPQ